MPTEQLTFPGFESYEAESAMFENRALVSCLLVLVLASATY